MFGTYFHTLDTKGRLTFPSKLREEFGDKFYVTRWLDDCLVAFSENEWQAVCEKIRSLPMGRSRDLQRYLFANAVEVEPDMQGRIMLPANLRENAGLVKDAVIIGVYNRAEIWDKQKWDDRINSIDSKDIEQSMMELEI